MTWRALDGLFLLRPLLLVPVWTTYLLAWGRPRGLWPEAPFWFGLGAVTSAFAAAFVLNQICDKEGDRINHKCLLLTSGAVSARAARLVYVVACLVALGLCAGVPAAALPVVFVLALGVAYSAPPWRWKDHAYAGLVCNFLAHGVAVYACGSLASGASPGGALRPSLPYAFGAAAAYLLTTLPDREGDERVGKRTLAVTLGPQRTARWALGWYLSAVLLALYEADVLFLLGVLPSGFWFVRTGRGDLAHASSAVRAAVLGLSLAAVMLHPWYGGVLVTGWVVTRAYYSRRWQLTYP